ncbi:hypothetical protein R1flu_003572 [Riccia fluitans]|uniref:Uncharacterized protein n=1 Tax=Riccia fluitans TaxID=41844 RepID=A0ABD1Y9E0_9MARC
MDKLNSHRNHDRWNETASVESRTVAAKHGVAHKICALPRTQTRRVASDPLLVSGALWLIAIFLTNAGRGHPGEAHDEEQGATWPNQAPREPAGVPLQIINDYLLCKAGSGPTPSRRYNLPTVSAFLRLTYYRLVNWAHMLAGGLALAVKEYVRKFSGGSGEAVVMVSWAPALMKIIKHNRALLFDSPLNCPEPWEVYTDCSGSYEQADVLRGVHSRRAVAKDALPRILRLRPEERIENASQQAPAQPQPRKRRAPTSSLAPARETQTATRPTRITRTTAEPEVGVVPSPPREVQEISSSSSTEQPPRKDPGDLAQGHIPPKAGRPTNRASRDQRGRRGGPAGRQGPQHTGGQTVSAPEPPRRLQTGGRQALNGSRQKAIEQIPLPPPGQKKKKNKTPAVQPGRKEIRRPNPRLENNARHRQPLKRSARTSDHAIPTKMFGDFTLSCLYSSGQHPRPPAFLN